MRRISNYFKSLQISDSEVSILDDFPSDFQSQLNLIASKLSSIENFTAGENLSEGDICYLKSDGKFWKANAISETTSAGMLAIANENISADASGEFRVKGKFITSGLSKGSTYYLDTIAGGITTTKPSTSGHVLRVIGYAPETTILFFDPDQTYIEIA